MSRNILQGLVGAWCPSLGPSGYTLLDRSGRGNHGTLTNMDAASDWVGTPGGWALDYDGTNDYVQLDANNKFISTPLTLSGWINTTVSGGDTQNGIIASCETAGGNANWAVTVNFLGGANKLNFWQTAGGSSLNSVTSVNTGVWIFWAVTRSAATTQIYINGREDASVATGTPQTAGTQITAIGRFGGFNGYHTPMQHGDIGIWHRTLQAPEIAVLYQTGMAGLGRLLTQRAQRRVFRTQAAVKSYLFVNRGQVIGGGTL